MLVRFYVKLILIILKPIICHFDYCAAVNYKFLLTFDISNCEIFPKFKAFKIVKRAVFDLLKSAKIDFT